MKTLDEAFAREYLDDLQKVISELDTRSIAEAIGWLRDARSKGRMIFLCGNGGSASIASQMVVDLVKGGSYGKPARFRVLGLTDSVSTITAYANDVGYDVVFEEPLRNFAGEGDVLIAVSGSGNSRNVIRAVEYANSIGCRTIGLTSARSGRLRELAQLPMVVPSLHMGRLEDCFFILTHILCYAFMEE